MDHLAHVGARECDLRLETPHDLGNILGLDVPKCSYDTFEIRLGGDEDPGASATNGAQRFCHRLEVEHELRVLPDELSDLIDEEVQTEARRLLVDVLLDPLGKTLDGDSVVPADLRQKAKRFVLADREVLGVGLGECRPAGRADCLPVGLPCRPVQPQVGVLERGELAPLVEVVLELGDMPLLAIVSLEFVQHLDEDLQNRRGVVAANPVELLVDVEEHAPRREQGRLAQIAPDNLVVDLGEDDIRRFAAIGQQTAIED